MKQSAWDILEKKYGRHASRPARQTPGDDQGVDGQTVDDKGIKSKSRSESKDQWKGSPATCKLSAFLKEFNHVGVSIQQTAAGDPVLCFNPGLGLRETDPERWDLCVQACDLYDQAKPDLQDFIKTGSLILERYTGIWF